MPICADSSETVDFVLATDKAKENPPTFQVRFLTDAETRKLRKLLEQAGNETDEDKSAQLVDAAIAVGVAGVRNLSFRGQPLKDLDAIAAAGGYSAILSSKEVWELAYGQLSAIGLAESDRFKSASAQGSAPAPSAKAADPVPV
jgi:hypothetical protein